MITDTIMSFFADLIDFLYDLMPLSLLNQFQGNFQLIDFTFLNYINVFISPAVLVVIINTWILVITGMFTWALIEWLYKKIPGVD